MVLEINFQLRSNASVDWACQRLREVLTELEGEGNYGFQIDCGSKEGSFKFYSYDAAKTDRIISRVRLISPLIEIQRA